MSKDSESLTSTIGIHRVRHFEDEGAYVQTGTRAAVIEFQAQGTTWEQGTTRFVFFLTDREAAQSAADMFRNLARRIDAKVLSDESWGKDEE